MPTITFQHYEVLARGDGAPWELGRGAMGVTYKALDTNLRVHVALKVIHPHQLHSELVAQRFVREARAAARLRHPHIAAVYHLGQEEKSWFYAMEFVEGDTAEALVKREGPLPEATVLVLAVQATRALQAASALGLVHRDIKPSNLMLARDGEEWQLKLIDFGLARTFAEEHEEDLAGVTHSGFVGTPYYASPEQLEQHELDIRSDIYSLGVTLWYLLTGKVPFTGSVVSVLSQHLHKAPPFDQLDGIVSPATRQLIEQMLQKDPGARPQSAIELRRAVERSQQALSGGATPTAPAAYPPAPPTLSTLPTVTGTSAENAETLAAPGATPSLIESFTEVADLGYAQLCRARDLANARDVAVLRIDPELTATPEALAEVQTAFARARELDHAGTWKMRALEHGRDGWRIVMDWHGGRTWRDLLRNRRELDPHAAFALLGAAAHGADALLAAGVAAPDLSLGSLWCLDSADATAAGVKILPFGFLRAQSLAETWAGDGTLIREGADFSANGGVAGSVHALARIAYETLGGTAGGTYSPLPALSEAANKILRAALRTPAQFPSVTAFIDQLASSQVEADTIAPVRRQNLPIATAETHAPAPPEIVRTTPDPLPISTPEPAAGEPPPPAAETPAAPPRNFPEDAPAATVTVDRTATATPRRLLIGAIAATALIGAIGGALIFGPSRKHGVTEQHPAPTPLASTATPVPTPTPAPVAIATPPPATPPPAPTPSRSDLALQRKATADRLRKAGEWNQAATELLGLRRDFPEYSAVAERDLELLLREVRWRYTPQGDRLPELTWAQVEVLRPTAEQAAAAGIPAAMILLGQHATERDWRSALQWYEKASPLAPRATARIGQLLAHFGTKQADFERAWKCFQDAEAAGDLDGKVLSADCYWDGTISGKTVANLKRDPQRAVRMLREIVENSSGAAASSVFNDAGNIETAQTQPTRSKLMLGSYYLEFERLPAAERPAWYREEEKTINHAAVLQRLLTDAAETYPEALSMLGVAAQEGIGVPKDSALALRYFDRGAARNDPASMWNFAKAIVGNRKPQDFPPQALSLIRRAAEKQNQSALDFLKKNNIPLKP